MKRIDIRIIFMILMLVFSISAACRLTSIISNDAEAQLLTVEAQVAATVDAMRTEEPEPEPEVLLTETPTAVSEEPVTEEEITPTATMTLAVQESISGQLFFPGGFLPPQRVVAYDVDEVGTYYAIEVYSGNTYTLEVPPGMYYILAYLIDEDGTSDPSRYSGAYSEFVLCGLHVDCDDHSLISIEVNLGETVTGIDPADWYLPEIHSGYWPSDPTLGENGAIDGRLSYPSDFIPPLRVVAFSLDTDDYYEVYSPLNAVSYRITDLPPGTYHVLAYLVDAEWDYCAAFTQYAKCDYWTWDCEYDLELLNELAEVTVFPGQIVRKVDLMDWDVPSNVGWPAEPER